MAHFFITVLIEHKNSYILAQTVIRYLYPISSYTGITILFKKINVTLI